MKHSFEHKGIVVEPRDFIGYDHLSAMTELGLNTLGIHNGGGCARTDVAEVIAPALKKEFRQQAADRGIMVEFELHAGSALLPRSLFAEHEDCFRFDMKTKKRTPDCNWCPTSAESMQIVTQHAAALASTLAPDTHRYFLWSDDGAAWCHCPGCAELSESDQELLTANRISEKLRETDPEAKTAYLAYIKTQAAPAMIKPSENVFLEFAPITRCQSHAINDPKCAVNRKVWNDLLAQMELFPADRVHILEYWLDSSLASNYKKPAKRVPFNKQIVAADIAAYHALGIRSITSFACYVDGEYIRQYGDREFKEYAELLNRY